MNECCDIDQLIVILPLSVVAWRHV